MSGTRRRSSARSPGKTMKGNVSVTRSEGEMSNVSDAVKRERKRSSSRTDRRLCKPSPPEKATKTPCACVETKPCQCQRMRQIMERLEVLARPTSRRLRTLWDENCGHLPPDRRDKIKSALEEDYFLSPEQTEEYFQMVSKCQKPWPGAHGSESRKEVVERQKELRQRQKWLVNFSAQVAYRMCDYIAKGGKEILVSNRLRSIADVVLERVAEILGEPKPTRTHSGRLQRFMVAISDRIAVWIENAVYRAEAMDENDVDDYVPDRHIRLDRQ